MSTYPRYCDVCGAANRVQARFCVACGNSLPIPMGGSSPTGSLAHQHLLKDRYSILHLLGQGGFGAVYKAEDTLFSHRLVAIKEMSQRDLKNQQEIAEATLFFKREAQMLAGLDHPSLPRIYDYFSDTERSYLVMDFIEGETLDEYVSKKGGILPVREVLEIGLQLCTVLEYLHSHHPPIIFRDLKPANVMRALDGHFYLIDFGIARYFKPGQTKDTINLGSPGYAAPEQYAKAQTQSNPRTDIYGLGAILHQLLSGNDPSQTPFQFASLQLSGQPFPGLDALIMQMVETRIDNRPVSMTIVRQEFQRLTAVKSKEQWLREGEAHHAAYHYQEALIAYEQAIRLDPNYASAYRGKGETLYRLNRFKEALADYEQAIRLDPNYALAFADKGQTLHRLNRFKEALVDYEQAIRLDPNYASAYRGKGETLYRLNRFKEALATSEQAIRLDPNDALAYMSKGVALFRLNRKDEAKSVFETALAVCESSSLSDSDRALIYLCVCQ